MKIVWTHPTNDKMTEVLCDKHSTEVISALRTLGIPFDGDETTGICLRCVYDGYPFREWMN